jgi:hypothetical protein
LPSLASALFKEWQRGFWVLRAEKLMVFESKEAYEAFKKHGAPPSLLKKRVQLAEGLQLTPIKFKDYGATFGRLHYFALEQLHHGATSMVLKFASDERGGVAFLHNALEARLAEAVKRRIDYAVKVVGSAGPRQRIIDEVVMKERTRMAAEGALGGGGGAGAAKT